MVRRLLQTTLLIAFFAPALACSDSEDTPPATTPQGGSSSTGNAGSGGAAAGAAGMSTGGAGGMGGAITDIVPPGDQTARPSAGCNGNASAVQGGQTLTSGGQLGNYFITVPAAYDGTAPQPLIFVFHGANNNEIQCRGGGNCTGVQASIESNAVTVYPRSFGTSWTDATREQNVTWFDDLLAHVKANYCVDERRVIAMGTSSGAHFSNILGCRRGDQLLAIAPGAGERLETTNCRGEVAALVIHGVDDTSVPFNRGEAARDYYAMANGCSTTTVPPIAEVHAEVRAERDAPDNPDAGATPRGIMRCADYQGCRPGLPVRWCEHGVPGYDGSTHGYPAQGGPETWDFVSEL
jgi:poly(3-hydroxybutyrate) depolymerase